MPATFAFLIGGGETTAPGDPEFFQVEALTVGVAILLLITYVAQTWFFLRSPESPSVTHGAGGGRRSGAGGSSLAILLASAAALTFASEVLVHNLEPAVASLGISEFFIGIILIPIIGNLAEHVVGRDAGLQEQDGLQPDHLDRIGDPDRALRRRRCSSSSASSSATR